VLGILSMHEQPPVFALVCCMLAWYQQSLLALAKW
jgi:hypothetical protein